MMNPNQRDLLFELPVSAVVSIIAAAGSLYLSFHHLASHESFLFSVFADVVNRLDQAPSCTQC
jgi:hypothetical protein